MGWFEESHHIVGIVRDPRHAEAHGTVVDRFTENVDVFPTLCDAMGIEIPAQGDGLPLTPFLAGDEPPWWRDAAHWEYDWRDRFIGHVPPAEWPWDRRLERHHLVVLRTEAHGYVQFGNGSWLCFDLAADPTWRTTTEDPAVVLPAGPGHADLAVRAQRADHDRHGPAGRRRRPLAPGPSPGPSPRPRPVSDRPRADERHGMALLDTSFAHRADIEPVSVPTAVREALIADGGDPGWLDAVPTLAARAAERWDLVLGAPFETGMAGWTAAATTEAGVEVVLKLSYPHLEARDEAAGLAAWHGAGAVEVLDAHAEDWALLLARLRPGTTLQDEGLPPDEHLTVGAALLGRMAPSRSPRGTRSGTSSRWPTGWRRSPPSGSNACCRPRRSRSTPDCAAMPSTCCGPCPATPRATVSPTATSTPATSFDRLTPHLAATRRRAGSPSIPSRSTATWPGIPGRC